jgi:hypothetical protein
MSRFSLSARDRRTVKLGAATLIAIVLLGKGVPRWRAWELDAVASAREVREELHRAQASVSALAALSDTAAARRSRINTLERGLIYAKTPAAAGATLAGFVAESADDAGVRLGAVQVRADTSTTVRYRRVGVSTEGVGGVRDVTEFVARLESSRARLVIREFAASQPDPTAPRERAEALRITLVVEALAAAPTPPSSRRADDRTRGERARRGSGTSPERWAAP